RSIGTPGSDAAGAEGAPDGPPRSKVFGEVVGGGPTSPPAGRPGWRPSSKKPFGAGRSTPRVGVGPTGASRSGSAAGDLGWRPSSKKPFGAGRSTPRVGV